jgi:hypothetical protein
MTNNLALSLYPLPPLKASGGSSREDPPFRRPNFRRPGLGPRSISASLSPSSPASKPASPSFVRSANLVSFLVLSVSPLAQSDSRSRSLSPVARSGSRVQSSFRSLEVSLASDPRCLRFFSLLWKISLPLLRIFTQNHEVATVKYRCKTRHFCA